jgi:asparagine synthase (glutamine-hydrolysing)
MCGIMGAIARDGSLSPDLLERATRTLAHRGPDDDGMVIIDGSSAERCQIGFAHTRLSIIDLSPLGHQPMQDPSTGNWIVFNGEIYNFRELRCDLMETGTEFRSQSDTEVVLAAYRVWGEQFLLRLRGMFAFALWDAQRKRLLLARDPMGIKPLYYYQSERDFLFASEVRTLLQTGLIPRKIDATGALSYLTFGSVSEPWTIVQGVRAVPPGHVLTWEQGSLSVREYWSILSGASGAVGENDPSRNGSGTRLPEILRESVLSHLVSDVPVGVFLSGGIDSSSLVAIMHRNGVRANTFSLVFREEEFNEAPYSRAVARGFDTEHLEIPVSQEDTLALLPEALRAMDQPTVDGINTYLVSAKARSAGVKVALTGLGADEMFAGYSNFRRVPQMERMAARLNRVPALARRPLAAFVAMVAGKSDRNRKLAELAAAAKESFVHPYFLVRELFAGVEQRALFPSDEYEAAKSSLDAVLSASIARSSTLDPVNRVSYLESHWYMRNTLLRDSDFMSMAHGLELRVPFLDRALVEACFRIPGKRKLQGSSPKSLLLASLGVELPGEIVKRPKRGFTFPFERWLRGEMRSVVENALLTNDSDQALLNSGAVHKVWNRFLAGETSWSRPWSLLVLKRWCEQNL